MDLMKSRQPETSRVLLPAGELEKALRRILNLAKNHQGPLVEAATKDDGLKMIEREADELLKLLT